MAPSPMAESAFRGSITRRSFPRRIPVRTIWKWIPRGRRRGCFSSRPRSVARCLERMERAIAKSLTCVPRRTVGARGTSLARRRNFIPITRPESDAPTANKLTEPPGRTWKTFISILPMNVVPSSETTMALVPWWMCVPMAAAYNQTILATEETMMSSWARVCAKISSFIPIIRPESAAPTAKTSQEPRGKTTLSSITIPSKNAVLSFPTRMELATSTTFAPCLRPLRLPLLLPLLLQHLRLRGLPLRPRKNPPRPRFHRRPQPKPRRQPQPQAQLKPILLLLPMNPPLPNPPPPWERPPRQRQRPPLQLRPPRFPPRPPTLPALNSPSIHPSRWWLSLAPMPHIPETCCNQSTFSTRPRLVALPWPIRRRAIATSSTFV
mmetsp:Transcript_1484/g.3282  ORF Transcript_1484/g.3282 Transcript_1484/m.3282 type:complete len:380 (+) Transcript_1484:996-2135(+)